LLLRRIQADVYHVLDNSYGHLALFLDPRKTVVTSHGGTPRSWRRWNPEGPAMWLFDLAFRGMLRAANIVIVSEYSKRELLAEANYPAARIHVIYHGIEPIFSPLPEAARMAKRASLLGPQDCHLLLHVGHSAARKNVETLYQALAVLRREGRAVHLLRIGSVPTPAQARLIEALNLTTAITHIPYVPNRELPSYYAAADAFVFPSFYEGFGVPLIEAMACGTPVVCSDWELFREVCGDAALFADPHRSEALAEAIGCLLEDYTAANNQRKLGLERVQQFTWERTVRETLTVYASLMDRT
jgi:glycosyltransferase involved in cell wall biosynthesis